ncbi:MAG: ligase-associated DNA damage response DEXH box helicase [Polyangiaceae bacterium]|nr:ligase-associated DNA damage response DEXH box helicase [Polyangiaceae bacterium]
MRSARRAPDPDAPPRPRPRWLPQRPEDIAARAAARAAAAAARPRRLSQRARGPVPPGASLEKLRGWFLSKGWAPFAFQEQTWAAFRAGQSGLVHVPTGAGKTYAAYFGPLAETLDEGRPGLQILYLTPLRAISRDIELALRAPVEALGYGLEVESRTGDTSSSARQRQKRRPPEVLITTPESLSLLLCQADAASYFGGLRAVLIDEWHELLATKRGTQVELALARLRRFAPGLRTWAMSATLANLGEAAQAATGAGAEPAIVTAPLARPVRVETLLPPEVDAFPWAGHLGLTMLEPVLGVLGKKGTTLVFTNTRAQAERWYQAIVEARPRWAAKVALHHGSLDRAERERVEGGLKAGSLRAVVATSSLDLGVDFAPVERVVQIGSPKSIGRLLQRAGRAAHRPGAPSELWLVPTHALELIEIAAARRALAAVAVEARRPLDRPFDVLAQHLVTCALGGGFRPAELYEEVCSTASYAALAPDEFGWVLALVRDGGEALYAYAEYHKISEIDGAYHMLEGRAARLHRANVGTIVAEGVVHVRVQRGPSLGTVEEGFVSRLKPGDTFLFAGRALAFVRLRDNVAEVRLSPGRAGQTPQWQGGRHPLSSSLADALRAEVGRAARGEIEGPEMQAASPVLEAQVALSTLPGEAQVLAEICETREGFHLFAYPFEGRLVHEGLAALLALRLSRARPATFSLSVNDYGLELLCPEPFPYAASLGPDLFDERNLDDDVVESVNVAELAKRQFREVARVAGLLHQGFADAQKSARQVQASSGLLYEVFRRHDPNNLLLAQARREVIERQFERERLRRALRRLRSAEWLVRPVSRPTPLGFPLLVERLSATLSSESLLERIERMKRQWVES